MEIKIPGLSDRIKVRGAADGDRLCLFTDGLVEAVGTGAPPFSHGRPGPA